MPKTAAAASDVNPSIIAFKPRQVLLWKPDMKENNKDKKSQNLKPDRKTLLLHSLAQYLERNGFSKTLKKFRSEAGIEKEDLGNSLDLEEIYCKYLEMGDHANGNFDKHKVLDTQMRGNSRRDAEVESVANVEASSRKKKKIDENDSHTIVGQSEKMITDDLGPDLNAKSKEKKKSKKTSDSLGQAEQISVEASKGLADSDVPDQCDKKGKVKKKKISNPDSKSIADNVKHHQSESLPVTTKEKSKDVVSSDSRQVTDSETEDKSRDKKKKNKRIFDSNEISLEGKSAKSKRKKKKTDGLVSKSLCGGYQEVLYNGKLIGNESKKDDNKTSEEDATNKVSKKRKRLDSEESDSQLVDNKESEELKRRKKDCFEEPKGTGQPANGNASIRTEKHAGVDGIQKTSRKQPDGQANGTLENSEARSAMQKSMQKQQSDSREPKKPFQRVNVDEVVFEDERLQDNSYWAKDGADTGYGAKAQEILGQVRGRGFRHEKTKKKRGTYRGGQIDLQSYSIKFNYSDDE